MNSQESLKTFIHTVYTGTHIYNDKTFVPRDFIMTNMTSLQL